MTTMKIIHLTYVAIISYYNGILVKAGEIPFATVSLIGRNKPAFFRGKNILKSKTAATVNHSTVVDLDLINNIPRGGACSDSNPALFVKIGATAIAESFVLLGLLLTSTKLTNNFTSIPTVFNEPLLELLASMMIIFGSSIFGAIVDGGLSAATKQTLNPTKVSGDPNWYANLKKPSWNPPGWLFPIMWLIVSKPTQLSALSRIFKYGKNVTTTSIPLFPAFIYTTTLALGDAWNKVFFGLECLGAGTVVILTFFTFLLLSTYLFYHIDPVAGYYMLPTCAWVFVATALQWSIYLKNKK
mmetsp:Transcript_24981/g.28581  ORF Transcript_24981/g.28581 Transcript_24981/m.28581 type:complete len:299 (+) Transcript_24981:54-950(+)